MSPAATWPISLLVLAPLTLLLCMFALLLILGRKEPIHHNFKQAALKTLLLALGLLVGLALAEGLLRLIDHDPWARGDMHQVDGYYHLVPDGRRADPLHDEGAELVVEEVGGEPFWYFKGPEWNSFGGRGPEPSQTKPDVRLVWMGNSIVFGSSVRVGQCMDKQLLSLLKKRQPDLRMESVNLAVPGYSLSAYKIALKRYLPELPADVLLVGLWDGGMDNAKLVDGVLLSADVEVVDGQRLMAALPFERQAMATLAAHSRLFETLMVALGAWLFEPKGQTISKTEKMLRDLNEIRVLAERLNLRLGLLWFPPLDRPFEQQLNDPDPDTETKIIRQVHYEAVSTWAAEKSVSLVDVRTLLLDMPVEDIRLDRCCHYNPEGHKILAERLLPFVLDLLDKR